MAQGSRRRGRIFVYLGLIILLALVLVWALFYRKQQQPQVSQLVLPTPTQQEELTDIVITTQKISRGGIITNDVVTTIKYPKKEKDIVAGTFFTTVDEVVGRLMRIDIDARVPLTFGMVLPAGVGSEAAFRIPKGMVAITIPASTSLTNVSYALQPGDHINVMASMLFVDIDANFQSKLPNNTAAVTAPVPGSPAAPAGLTVTFADSTTPQGRAELDPTLNQPIYAIPSELQQRPRLVSQALIQDAIVLFVGDYQIPAPVKPTPQPGIAPTPTPQGAQPTAVPPAPPKPNMITIVVSPQDAVTLNYLVAAGARLTMTLRGAGDDQKNPTEAVTLQYLMDQYSIPLPAKLPYGLEPRVDSLSPSTGSAAAAPPQ